MFDAAAVGIMKSSIEDAGGSVVTQGRIDFFVENTIKSEEVITSGLRVTFIWLELCLIEGKILDISENFIYQPLSVCPTLDCFSPLLSNY